MKLRFAHYKCVLNAFWKTSLTSFHSFYQRHKQSFVRMRWRSKFTVFTGGSVRFSRPMWASLRTLHAVRFDCRCIHSHVFEFFKANFVSKLSSPDASSLASSFNIWLICRHLKSSIIDNNKSDVIVHLTGWMFLSFSRVMFSVIQMTF